jgi:tetratricopeptide (TPR) repeat protein
MSITTALLCLLPSTILVPTPVQKNVGWKGEIIIIKSHPCPVGKLDAEGKFESIGSCQSLEYTVLEDRNNYLRVMDPRGEVWVEKERSVLLKEAVAFFTSQIEANPNDHYSYAYRGWTYHRRGLSEKGIEDYNEAIRISPGLTTWNNNRGLIYADTKQYDKAIDDYTEVLKNNPNDPLLLRSRGWVHMLNRDYAKSIADYEASINLQGNLANPHNGLAWVLANCPDPKLRDGDKALKMATKACELTMYKNPSHLETLACAHAEKGNFDEAVKWLQKAINSSDFPRKDLEEAKKRLELFKDKKPYRLEEKKPKDDRPKEEKSKDDKPVEKKNP